MQTFEEMREKNRNPKIEMPDAYFQLLDATIQQLEELKARGTRFVSVSPQMLETLARQQEGRKNFKLQTSNSRETSQQDHKTTGPQDRGMGENSKLQTPNSQETSISN